MPALPQPTKQAHEQPAGAEAGIPILLAAAFVLFLICDSLVFNATTIALPKVAQHHLTGLFADPASIGTIVSIVFALAALAQLWVGRLIDRMPLPRIFVSLAFIQVLALIAAGATDGAWFVAPALAMMFVVFGLIPIGDALVARHVADSWRSRAYAISYVIAFGIGPAAVPLIAALYDENPGFPLLFPVLAAITGGTLIAAIAMAGRMKAAGALSRSA